MPKTTERLFFRNWWDRQDYWKRRKKGAYEGAPPWIKLWISVGFSRKTVGFSDKTFGCLVRLLLAAAQDSGHIPADPKVAAKVAGCTHLTTLQPFMHMLEPCSEPCHHVPVYARCRHDVDTLRTSCVRNVASEERRGEEKTTTTRRAPGGAGAAPPRSSSKSEQSEPQPRPRKKTDFQHALETFQQHHQRVLGVPYLPNFSRDNKLLTPAIRTYGLPALKEIIGYFWQEQAERERGNSTWIGKAAPSIPSLVRQLPNILRDYTIDSLKGKNH